MLILAQDAATSFSMVKEIQQVWPFGAVLAIALGLVIAAMKFGWAPYRRSRLEFNAAEKKLREEEAEAQSKREQEVLQLKLQIEQAKSNQTEQMTRCSANHVRAEELHVELTKQQIRLQEMLEPHIKILKSN